MDNQFKLLPLPSFSFFVFIFMVFKLLIIMRFKREQQSPRNTLPPSPWKLPLIGHLHHLISTRPHHRLAQLARRHGSVMHLQLGELSHVVVSSPEAAQQVMKTHDIVFANRPYTLTAEIILYNFSDIGFAPYGGYWRQLRKVCTTELLSEKRVRSFRSIREEEVSSLIRSILTNSTGSEINLGRMLSNLSYNIILRTCFGKRCKQHETFISIIRGLSEAGSGFSISDLFPSVKLLALITGVRAKLERFHRDFDTMLESIIEEHRSSHADPSDNDDVTDDLVDVLLKIQDHGDLEFPLKTDNIKAVILDMLLAGTETSSTLAEWAMSEMIKNPKILKKAQTEVRRVYDGTGDVDESKLHELEYLKCVIKETLRLHPPLPLLLPRESTEKREINGYEIPAKTKVIKFAIF